MAEPTEKTPRKVRIVCTTDKRPWTEAGPLEEGEEALIAPETAELLIANQHARKA